MIKIKFSILAVMLMTALFSFSSCSDDDDTYLPPNQAIINALNQLYPRCEKHRMGAERCLLCGGLLGRK